MSNRNNKSSKRDKSAPTTNTTETLPQDSNQNTRKENVPNEESAKRSTSSTHSGISLTDKKVKELKRQKNFIKLPSESSVAGHSLEKENVGDDLSRKGIHILCECKPNVTGAAVPVVTSPYNKSAENTPADTRKTKNFLIINKNKLLEKRTSTRNTEIRQHSAQTNILKGKQISSSDQVKNKYETRNKLSTENVNDGNNPQTKKPSLIPKLKITNSDNGKIHQNSGESQTGNFAKLHPVMKEQKPFSKASEQNITVKSASGTISSKMTGLQERLKATTSLLRQTIDLEKNTEHLQDENCKIILSKDIVLNTKEASSNTDSNSKPTVEDLHEIISHLENTVSSLSELSLFSNHKKYIDKLFLNITEIKNITTRLSERENIPNSDLSELDEIDDSIDKSNNVSLTGNEKTSGGTKDNKIYIKIADCRKRKLEMSQENTEGVQTELSLGSKLTSESLNSDTSLKSKVKETDSLDGVFIPSYETPRNMDEDEDETNSLDITITFPEIEKLESHDMGSQLKVCLSDISAEALTKLKRCPKDFKLLMDFVEGKVSFQSGTGKNNSFSISPDLKFIENIVDEKESNIISIKPSTECVYSSQLMPVVENNDKPKVSLKTLKSTDSELFNVVNLPFWCTTPHLDEALCHRSCITFRNDAFLPTALAVRQFYKSMPQITSLTNIFEDDIITKFSRTGKVAKKSSESKEEDYL